jgi:hypothetical protein
MFRTWSSKPQSLGHGRRFHSFAYPPGTFCFSSFSLFISTCSSFTYKYVQVSTVFTQKSNEPFSKSHFLFRPSSSHQTRVPLLLTSFPPSHTWIVVCAVGCSPNSSPPLFLAWIAPILFSGHVLREDDPSPTLEEGIRLGCHSITL